MRREEKGASPLLLSSSLKAHNSGPRMREIPDKPRLREISQNARTGIFETVKVMKHKERLRNVTHPRRRAAPDDSLKHGSLAQGLRKGKETGGKRAIF